MSKKVRGFEVLTEFITKVVTIMTNDPNCKETYGTPGDIGEDNWIPRRETSKSAGYDLRSVEDTTINPMQWKLVGTGLTAYMKDNEELQIRPRSGLSYKKGIMILNSPGTIDSDYYGKHIGVIVMNLGPEPFEIKAGDRIAQGVFSKYKITDDDNPIRSERTGGFGSTGER